MQKIIISVVAVPACYTAFIGNYLPGESLKLHILYLLPAAALLSLNWVP
jgi:hypothetical protein